MMKLEEERFLDSNRFYKKDRKKWKGKGTHMRTGLKG